MVTQQICSQVLVIFFRFVNVMLLLKMLFAIVFEGYKNVAQKKSRKGNSVLKDVTEMSGAYQAGSSQ